MPSVGSGTVMSFVYCFRSNHFVVGFHLLLANLTAIFVFALLGMGFDERVPWVSLGMLVERRIYETVDYTCLLLTFPRLKVGRAMIETYKLCMVPKNWSRKIQSTGHLTQLTGRQFQTIKAKYLFTVHHKM